MSHTTTIKSVEIRDVHALKAAIKELREKGVDCTLLENETPKAFYANQAGMSEVAAYVLRSPHVAYDVAFYWDAPKKSLEMRTDLYGGSVARSYGNGTDAPLGKLLQLYSKHAVIRQAAKQGYRVAHRELADGSIKLTVTGMN